MAVLGFDHVYKRAPDQSIVEISAQEAAAIEQAGVMPDYQMINGVPVLLSAADAENIEQSDIPTPRYVLARDIVDKWTPSDLVMIEAVMEQSADARLFSRRLDVRGEKRIDVLAEDFQQAWGLIAMAVGQQRADELMALIMKEARPQR